MTHPLDGIDRKLALVVVLLCVPLLFLPKINIVSLEGETAGLRIDDVMLLAAALILLFARMASNRPLIKIEGVFLLFFVATLFSAILGWFFYSIGYVGTPPRIMYVLRNLEYFVFFYAGLLCFRFFDPVRLVFAWFAFNVVLMLLQWGGLLGGFSVYGYMDAGSLDGPPGITNGHWEIGFILGICYVMFATWLPSLCRFGQIGNYLFQFGLFCLTLFLIVIATSRSGILALFIATIYLLVRSWSTMQRLVALTLCVGVAILVVSVMADGDAWNDFAIVRRSAGLLSWKNLAIVESVYAKVDTDASFEESFSKAAQPKESVDLSWQFRVHKWLYVIKYYASRPACFLFGLGPGFCSTGLDGGILRLFVEGGLVGGGLFLLLLGTVGKRDVCLAGCVLVLIVNMVFLDMHLAYKAVSMFYFLVGACYTDKIFCEQASRSVLQ